MSKNTIHIQYIGFEPRALVRLYSFRVLEASNEPREFTLSIANEAFLARRARYQDAPDICFLKLQHELTVHENRPSETHFAITDAELESYRDAHTQKTARRH